MSDFNRESTLHAQLKAFYTGIDGQQEVAIGSYICDGRTRSGELIEIQIGSFGPLKEKLQYLAQEHRIKIVHPIIRNRIIETYSADKLILRKRYSPKKGTIWDIYKSLIYAPELVLLKNITIELVALDITERRIEDGRGSWRRKGISLQDKVLLALHDTRSLSYPIDYQSFIPFSLKDPFTIRDFYNSCIDIQTSHKAVLLKCFSDPLHEPFSYAIAQKAIYVLYRIGILERTGKKGKFYLYRKTLEHL